MADFNTVGLDNVALALVKRSNNIDATTDAMLNAGADVLVEGQRNEANAMFSSRSTGDLAASIRKDKIKNDGSGKSIEIYPHGKDRHGIRNATKGFVLEYGRSNMSARPYMTEASEKYADAVNKAMREKWETNIDG